MRTARLPEFVTAISIGLLLTITFSPRGSQAQAVITVSEDINMRFGIQLQGWADWTQDAATGGTQENLFLRRARFLVGGQIARDVSFFFQTDNPNLGKSTGTSKTISSGFIVQDAFLSWKINDAFILDGGLFIVPLSRNILQSTVSFFTLDISPVSTVMAVPMQTAGLRDTGFQARGYLVDDGRFEYRLAVFEGVREPGSRNAFRTTGYIQYNFFEREKGYVFAGTNLGKKKILNVSAGLDAQKSYYAYSADIFGTIPVRGGDEIGGQFQWIHYNGQDFIKTIPQQNGYLVEAAYYVSAAKLQPFAKFESQKFSATPNAVNDVDRFGGGVNYYIWGQNLKVTLQYIRSDPENEKIRGTNQFTVQLQAFYF